MEIKTVGDWRKLIDDNGGVLKINKLTLEYSANEDIDVKFDGDLLQWLGEEEKDETSINEAYWTVDSDYEKHKESNKENIQLKVKITELEKTIESASKDTGKVEAYEKILIGRTVSVGA